MSSKDESVRPKVRSKHSEKLIGEPLDRKVIKFLDRDGFERNYPALDSKFSYSMVFTKYTKPLINGQDVNTSDRIKNWMSNMDSFELMLKTVLGLQQNQFWSTLLHQNGLQICLESYLRSAPRSYDLDNNLITNEMKASMKRVHSFVFKVYLRICSFAESKTLISEKTFGKLVFDSYLIDFPIMIDLSVLYVNSQYRHLLMRMLSTVIQCQPLYEEELRKGCDYFRDLLNAIQRRLGVNENQMDMKSKLSSIPLSELQYIISQMIETSVSLHSLLQTLPQMSGLYRSASIDKTIVEFYNRVFPSIQMELNSRLDSNETYNFDVDHMKWQLMRARTQLINTFRDIIKLYFLDELLNSNSRLESKVCLIDELIESLTLAAYERSFIIDYCTQYPIERDLSELSSHSELTEFKNYDKSRIDYLKSVIQSSVAFEPKAQNNAIHYDSEDKVNGFANSDEMNGGIDVELESSIHYIQDVIPDLGPGFVQKCLQFYKMDNEMVLNAILENNLPPELSALDRKLQKVPKRQSNEMTIVVNSESKDTIQSKPSVPEVIDERHNVYNNDEFDIFRNKNIDLNRVHIGKQEKTEQKLDLKTKEKIISITELQEKEEEERELRGFYDYDDDFEDTFQNEPQIDLPNDKLLDELDTNESKANPDNDWEDQQNSRRGYSGRNSDHNQRNDNRGRGRHQNNRNDNSGRDGHQYTRKDNRGRDDQQNSRNYSSRDGHQNSRDDSTEGDNHQNYRNNSSRDGYQNSRNDNRGRVGHQNNRNDYRGRDGHQNSRNDNRDRDGQQNNRNDNSGRDDEQNSGNDITGGDSHHNHRHSSSRDGHQSHRHSSKWR